MANRSDRQSDFPRYIKRMLALQPFKNAHQAGESRRIWINAHKHHRDYLNKRGAQAVGQYNIESD